MSGLQIVGEIGPATFCPERVPAIGLPVQGLPCAPVAPYYPAASRSASRARWRREAEPNTVTLDLTRGWRQDPAACYAAEYAVFTVLRGPVEY